MAITGHVEKIYKTSCRIVIDLGRNPATGKRKRIYKSFKGDEVEATKEMYRMIRELETGSYIEPSEITVGEWIKTWLESKKNKLAATTYSDYLNIANLRIVPKLGAIKLKDLKPMHIYTFYTEIEKDRRVQTKNGYEVSELAEEKPLSASAIRHHHAVINGALKTAFKLKMIEYNPASGIELPSAKRKPVKILTKEELSCMLEELKSTPHYVPIVFTLSTGMRRGEVYGLRWQDIDLDAGIVTVNQTLIYTPETGTRFKDNTKNGKVRRITIPPLIVDLLKRHKAEQDSKKAKQGARYTDKGLVFARPDGNPQHIDTISSWFTKFAERHGFDDVTFHKLRHTHISFLIDKGIMVKAIQERAGHSSAKVTLDVYGHLMPGYQEQLADKINIGLEAMLGKDNKKTVAKS